MSIRKLSKSTTGSDENVGFIAGDEGDRTTTGGRGGSGGFARSDGVSSSKPGTDRASRAEESVASARREKPFVEKAFIGEGCSSARVSSSNVRNVNLLSVASARLEKEVACL